MKKFESMGVEMTSKVSVIPTNPKMVISCVEAFHALDELMEDAREFKERGLAFHEMDVESLNQHLAIALDYVETMYNTFRDEN